MLKIGQRVKVANKLRNTVNNEHTVEGGMITTIVGYAGEANTKKGLQECYYVAACKFPITRRSLYPIDDEPCTDEFIKEFKELLNAKNTA